ncbi:MAG: FIST C-terminal domain-containing protein [Saprospiraceae bacterium]|nr:FIST C-terminal domain-containing protein [Saprospiraceae bacterium]
MITKSYHCASISQLKQILATANTANFKPSLGIVFSSVDLDLEQVRMSFATQDIALVGCTTAGEIINNSLYEKSLALLLFDINPAFFKIKLTEYETPNITSAAEEIGGFVKGCFAKPGMLLMSGGLAIDAQRLVQGINSSISLPIPIYGGLAGDDLQMVRTFAFTHEGITENGAASLVLDTNRVELTGLAISGWKPIGGVNVITKAEGNQVYEINGEPAYDVFVRYFGLTEAETKHDQLIGIQTNYPFQILREGGKSILRSPLLIHKDTKSISLTASVKEGDQFRFSTSPGFEVIEQTIEGFKALKTAAPEADALVVFSCKGRHGAFGPMLNKEIQGIYDYWEKPLIGFLSYGEVANLSAEKIEFHNETCAAVILKEK